MCRRLGAPEVRCHVGRPTLTSHKTASPWRHSRPEACWRPELLIVASPWESLEQESIVLRARQVGVSGGRGAMTMVTTAVQRTSVPARDQGEEGAACLRC